MAIAAAERSFDMGRVIQRSLSSLRGNLVTFGGLALLLSVAPSLLVAAVRQVLTANLPADSAIWAGGLAGLAIGLVNLAGAYVLQAAVVHGVVMDLNGRQANYSDCLQTGVRVLLPAIWISFLVGIGVSMGLILLIVPGVILALMWCVAIPVKVIEGRPAGRCLDRSADLTRGSRGALFGLFVIYLVIYVLADILIVGIVSALSGGLSLAGFLGTSNGPLGDYVIQPLAQMFSGLLGSALIACIYYELRANKDGVGPESLASVFD